MLIFLKKIFLLNLGLVRLSLGNTLGKALGAGHDIKNMLGRKHR